MSEIKPKGSAGEVPAKDSAKRRLAEAERIYGAPDREETSDANRDLKKLQTTKKPDEDVVRNVNVRKPI
jgi:hypothetical protein